ncbi:SWF/SNF helicase family protein [Massilia sp. H-1]|nr:SWF/SNF helicase family protein [Massilia sp. H-1]
MKRRREKLKRRVEDEKIKQRGGKPLAETIQSFGTVEDIWDSSEDMNPDDYEQFEEEVVDQATAAQTIAELEAEIFTLGHLEEQARALVHSGQDRKWEELRELLQNTPEMHGADGLQRKLIIFTEHRDTLNYLAVQIRGLLGNTEAVTMIHGGVKREDRRKVQELFRNDKDTRVLLATDAAGEGVNLQNANLMVNYDLPWNPNRLEQRFGRIHRIGQTEVCHLWNMVASETREGEVFHKLFEKIEIERKALGGRVFDVLGEVFDGVSLRELLIDAIRYGDDPAVRARLTQKVEGALDTSHLHEIISRNALAEEIMDEKRLFALKEEMEKAEARKLQPYFIRSFFAQAFERLGGDLRPRGSGRYEITFVPGLIRERDRHISGRDRRNMDPVLVKYERVCFEKQFVRLLDRPSEPMASLVHPAHPLMHSVVDLMLEQHRGKLKQGTILVDPNDDSLDTKLLFLIDHSIREGDEGALVVSRRFTIRFRRHERRGSKRRLGSPLGPQSDRVRRASARFYPEIDAEWIKKDLEENALAHASEKLVPAHFEEVSQRREAQVDKNLTAIHERLIKEIDYWSDRHEKFKSDLAAGKDVRLTLENVRRTIDELTARLETRTKELRTSATCRVLDPGRGGWRVGDSGRIACTAPWRRRRRDLDCRCSRPRTRRACGHAGRPQG